MRKMCLNYANERIPPFSNKKGQDYILLFNMISDTGISKEQFQTCFQSFIALPPAGLAHICKVLPLIWYGQVKGRIINEIHSILTVDEFHFRLEGPCLRLGYGRKSHSHDYCQ